MNAWGVKAFGAALCASLTALSLSGCGESRPSAENSQGEELSFPAADRPVASIVSSRWSNEEDRDQRNESDIVMNLAKIRPGMTVADIGAGEGYYTIRLSARVGAKGRVLAEDIVPEVRDALAQRVARERLDNVSVRLGEGHDPKLPENSFDRIFMVHMYHEIQTPYEFLWRMRPSLHSDGMVVVVDANRATKRHGTPPELLTCEFEAVGYKRVALHNLPSAGGYLAMFKPDGERPSPNQIRPCRNPHPDTEATQDDSSAKTPMASDSTLALKPH